MNHAFQPEKIARQFGRAACNYDSLAIVQREIADDLMRFLSVKQYHRLLDVGCGTGRVTRQHSRYAQQVVGLDLSLGMLQFAEQQNVISTDSKITWLNGDADNLPLMEGSFDGIFSSMALQWSKDIVSCFRELFRVAQEGATVGLAIMSHGSLFELANAWQIIDKNQHINSFHDSDTLFSAARQAGFCGEVDVREYTTWHHDVSNAMHSIKDIGARKRLIAERENKQSNIVSLTKSRLQRLQKHYSELYEQSGRLPLTYKVTFLQLHK